jgi:ABC-2 type transport system permease protein
MSTRVKDLPRVRESKRRTAPPHLRSLGAVVRRGLLDRRRSVLVWGASLGALGAFMAAIYPSIQTTIESVAKNYPAGLKEAFGVQAMNTVEGYVHAEMFSLIVPLAIGYLAIRGIASAIVGAEERGHLDTVLALPISRSVLLVGAYVVTAAITAVIMSVTGLMTFIAGRVAGTHISAGLVAAGVMGVWPLALFFAGAAAIGCGTLHSSRSVMGISLGALVGMYALDLAGRLAHGLEPLRWASAFRYYGAPMRDGIDPVAFFGLTVAGLVLVAIGGLLFERRDVLH